MFGEIIAVITWQTVAPMWAASIFHSLFSILIGVGAFCTIFFFSLRSNVKYSSYGLFVLIATIYVYDQYEKTFFKCEKSLAHYEESYYNCYIKEEADGPWSLKYSTTKGSEPYTKYDLSLYQGE